MAIKETKSFVLPGEGGFSVRIPYSLKTSTSWSGWGMMGDNKSNTTEFIRLTASSRID